MTLFVRIKPNQRQDKLEKVEGDWQIRLKAPAVDGKANEHLITFLASVLEISKSSISIKKGQRSRLKYLEVDESKEYVEEKLSLAAGN
ncbi:MAG TPA: DUF167 domain-containing protein [Bacteroidia bacterium]|nr:DUF167 domain-containing protein [Bacteroidia bacterium]HNS11716.1 DUF167 domain-containing protein [Bacteroidia bacterium]